MYTRLIQTSLQELTFLEMRLKKSEHTTPPPAGRWNSFGNYYFICSFRSSDEVYAEFFEYLKRPVFWFFGSLSIYLIPTHWFFTTRRRPKILNHLLPTHLSRTTKTVFFWEQVKFKSGMGIFDDSEHIQSSEFY